MKLIKRTIARTKHLFDNILRNQFAVRSVLLLRKRSENAQLVDKRFVQLISQLISSDIGQLATKTVENAFGCASVPFLATFTGKDIAMSFAFDNFENFIPCTANHQGLTWLECFHRFVDQNATMRPWGGNDKLVRRWQYSIDAKRAKTD